MTRASWGPQEPPFSSSSFALTVGRQRWRGSVRLVEECAQGSPGAASFASSLRQPPDLTPGLWGELQRPPTAERGAYDSFFQPATPSPGAFLAAREWSNPHPSGSAKAALAELRRHTVVEARSRQAAAREVVAVAAERLSRRRSEPRNGSAEEAGCWLDEADVRLAELQAQLQACRSSTRAAQSADARAAVTAAAAVRYNAPTASYDY